MNKSDKKKMCAGCRNNRYNMGRGFVERPGIDAIVTSDECWNLKGAKVVMRRMVSYSQIPPWNQAKIRVLDCKTVEGYIFTDKTC